jgi:hypothetical protein
MQDGLFLKNVTDYKLLLAKSIISLLEISKDAEVFRTGVTGLLMGELKNEISDEDMSRYKRLCRKHDLMRLF